MSQNFTKAFMDKIKRGGNAVYTDGKREGLIACVKERVITFKYRFTKKAFDDGRLYVVLGTYPEIEIGQARDIAQNCWWFKHYYEYDPRKFKDISILEDLRPMYEYQETSCYHRCGWAGYEDWYQKYQVMDITKFGKHHDLASERDFQEAFKKSDEYHQHGWDAITEEWCDHYIWMLMNYHINEKRHWSHPDNFEAVLHEKRGILYRRVRYRNGRECRYSLNPSINFKIAHLRVIEVHDKNRNWDKFAVGYQKKYGYADTY